MFIDARQVQSGSEISADICIIGAGAAGIAIAREFLGTKTSVCVVESGGLDPASDVQALAKGASVGLPYPDLETTRVRVFGGSTNHWGGECRPLDAQDFAVREWIPHSGWPITLQDLVPYYRRAADVVETGPYEYYASDWSAVSRFRAGLRPWRAAAAELTPRVFQNSPPTRFGTRYRAELEAAPNIRVLLRADFTAFQTDEEKRLVDAIKVATLDGRDFAVKARVFVLATGALENARLLLISAGETASFGNQSGAVGRFFQEHVAHQWLASLLPATSFAVSDYEPPRQGSVALAFTAAEQRQRKLANFLVFLDGRRAGADSEGVHSARTLLGGLQTGNMPDNVFEHLRRIMADLPGVTRYAYRRLTGAADAVGFVEIGFVTEQMPNPDSRVRLSGRRDALGMPMTELDWQLTDLDRQAMLAGLENVVRVIGANGLGRVKVMVPEDGADWLTRIGMSFHPMGTTRMHDDPRHGVVDANCRVHGMQNLYVAGSSVFPTSGAGSPTYTLVTLALRLADHLKRDAA